MKQIQLIFPLIVLFLISCHPDGKQSIEEANKSLRFPVVLDTFGVDQLLRLYEDEHATWLTTSNYSFYFIGKAEDTLYLNPFINSFSAPPFILPSGEKIANRTKITEPENPFAKYHIEWGEERSYRYWTQAKIEIQLDTTKKLSNAYPVVLTNIDTDTIFIGYGSHVPLIMEAIDTSGNWKPIQKRFIYMCGNGIGSFILPPNECVLTLAPIFQGNYKTKLRLTLGDNHSKPFTGFINYRQFQSIFDEHGGYKEEYKREMDDGKRSTNR